jgi:hypothetical protein
LARGGGVLGLPGAAPTVGFPVTYRPRFRPVRRARTGVDARHMADPQFILKTTPPRAHRMALLRPRLQNVWDEINDHTTIAVCGPRGFGKTTLLVQWRRQWLERGALVGWVTLDERDDPERFAVALLYAMRAASRRPRST